MKKYDVYGIGNALVDLEFEVTDDFLRETHLDKGVMTLVSPDRLNELEKNVAKAELKKRSCGGSAANTVIAVSQFGGNSFYSCKVANDELGTFYYDDIVKNGVSTNISDNRQSGETGRCMVFITPDADRTMNTYLGITERFSTEELIEAEMVQSKYIYIEGYLLASPSAKGACIKAREIAKANGVKSALTFSDPNIVSFFRTGIDQVIDGKIDLIFCNEDEALEYTQKKNMEEATEVLKSVAKTFAVTMGPEGALVYDGKELHHIKTENVKAINTNGAGDLFAGAFLYGITNGMDFKKAGELACKSSTKLVQEFGARLETETIQEILKSL